MFHMTKETFAATDPLFNLEKEQLISMIHFVYKLKDEEAEKNKAIMQRLDAIQEKLDLAASRHEADAKYATKLLAEISRLNKRMEELMDERRRSDRTIADLQSQLEVYKKNKFKGTSQKGRKARCAEDKNDKENDRHDFDGTASSKSKNAEEPVKEKEAETGHSDGYILHRTLAEMNNEGESRNSLLYKVVNYLSTYWKQLFAYRNDGRYTIDNSLAERSIRPITVERKQLMFYGSHKEAGLSVVYHTFVETCRLAGVSVLDFFTLFFTAVMNGREDYQNLLPNTIGIKK